MKRHEKRANAILQPIDSQDLGTDGFLVACSGSGAYSGEIGTKRVLPQIAST
jgi:hypothetical protein